MHASLALQLFCLAFVFLSCTQPENSASLRAITNRTQRQEPLALVLVKLKAPALLSRPQVTEEDKEEILAEQEGFLESLEALSAEIKVVYRYRLVVNGLALLVPTALRGKVGAIPGVHTMYGGTSFARPTFETGGPSLPQTPSLVPPGKGQDIRVGVIDGGIDYTHKMFGGSGDVEEYKRSVAAKAEGKPPQNFPSTKVAGGIDLVGQTYNDTSVTFTERVPHPDDNPLDEGGHGTHVAGTILEGAPGVSLWAIKVFGREGGTSDSAVIAALEYAADPDGDLDPSDRLDVVNLSLGIKFGVPYTLYDEAVANVVRAGTTVVASAGNSGPIPYSVGLPGSTDAAISVGASLASGRLAPFSSIGPRSLDSHIKPELVAPGDNIISARVGSGSDTLSMSGSSMATPQVTAAVALLKERRRNLDESAVKSLLLGNARFLKDPSGKHLPVSQQGAGLLQIAASLAGDLVVEPATLSLGEVVVEKRKRVERRLTLRNLGDAASRWKVGADLRPGITFSGPSELLVPAGSSVEIAVTFEISADGLANVQELDGSLYLTREPEVAGGRSLPQTPSLAIPVLAVAKKLSRIGVEPVQIHASSADDAEGAQASVTLVNHGKTSGPAYLFNLLDRDEPHEGVGPWGREVDLCDLASVGYRIITRDFAGIKYDFLEIAAQLHRPLTNWQHCEISVQIDQNGDGITDQELLGTNLRTLSPQRQPGIFASVLTDATRMRQIRSEYENGGSNDYFPAVVDIEDLHTFPHASLVILQARLDKLARTPLGQLRVKIASLVATQVLHTADDFLGHQEARWQVLDLVPIAEGFYNLPDTINLSPGEHKTVSFTRGQAGSTLVAYFPNNKASSSVLMPGKQALVLRSRYVDAPEEE